MTAAPTIGEVLVCSVLEPESARREHLRARLPGHDLRGLHQRARAHRVTSAVHRFVEDFDGLDAIERQLLAEDAEAALRRHLRALLDVEAIGATLDAAGIPWLVIKGPALVQQLYRDDGLRSYADLDVVVPRPSFRAAVAHLLGAGMPLVRSDWARATEELAGEVCLIGPYGTSIDLHWDILYHQASRARVSVDVDALFDRAVPVQLGATGAATLDPVDTILHLALHAASGGGGRLQWIKDLERATSVGTPDWDALLSRARSWRLSLVTGVMLDRARAVLGAEVPVEVLAQLGGRAWRGTIRAAERLWPVEAGSGRRSVPTMLVRATGSSGRVSLLPLIRQVRAALRSPAAPPTTVELQPSPDDALERFLITVSERPGRRSDTPVGERSPR